MKKVLLMCVFWVWLIPFAIAQNQISGKVIDFTNGQSIPGVNILIKGTTIGTTSDIDGNYSLQVPSEEAVIVFSFIGYETREEVVAGRSVIDVSLMTDIQQLNEVVVTALGIKREKKALGYAVTQISGDEISVAKEVNLVNSLSGKVAGVDISTSTAGPSGSTRVVMRGNSQLAGSNQPLYVIDGVPMDNSQMGSAGQWGGYDLGDGISNINPSDVESISVLKGASASALYGSRASNGVILIVTKSGRGQKGVGVEFTSNFTFEKVLSKFDDYQKVYGQGRDGLIPAINNTNNTQAAWGAKLDPDLMVPIYNGQMKPYGLVNDNILSFFRTGTTATNTISVSTGNETSSVRFSISDLRNQDIVPETGLTRNTFLINSNVGIGKRLSVSGKVNYIKEKVDNRPALSDNANNVGLALIGIAPNFDQQWLSEGYKDEFGNYEDWNGNIFRINPYWSINEISNYSDRDRIIGFLQLNYDFTDWLSLQVRGGTDFYNFRFTNFSPRGTPVWETGALEEINRNVVESNYEALLKFERSFGEDFFTTAFVGGNIMNSQSETFSQVGSDIVLEDVEKITNFNDQRNSYGFYEKQINSVYGAIQTGYKDTYFVDATFRNDWYSTLRKGLNSYFYPSVSGSFVFSNLLPQNIPLSFGKLRASWAAVGGDLEPYQLNLAYGLKDFSLLGRPLGEIANTSIPNLDLKPTRTYSYEFGTNLRFFQNRIDLDFTYYNTRTINQILRLTVPSTSGYNTAVINAGEITNKGIEVMLSGTPVRTDNFSWDVTVNYSKNINNVVELHEEVKDYLLANARWAGAAVMAREGEPYGAIIGRRPLRDPNGNVIHNDAGLPTYGESQEVLGTGVYEWLSGVTNTYTYKGFRLSALVDIKVGADVYSMSNAIAHANGTAEATLEGRDEWYASEEARLAAGIAPGAWESTGGFIGDGVINTGTAENPEYVENTIYVNPQSYWSSTFGDNASPEPFIYDATYAKLRELTLGYTLPSKLLGNTPIESVTLSFVARNLFILYSNIPNVDPESSYNNGNGQGFEYGSIPSRRSFGFSLNVKL